MFAPDTLVLIGSFLEISDILKSMSGVCKFWNQVSLGDFLWKIVFQREFGTVDWFLEKLNSNYYFYGEWFGYDSLDDEDYEDTSPITLELVQQVLEDCYGENRFWLSLFKLVVSMIPIQNYKMMTEKQIIQSLEAQPRAQKAVDYDDEEEFFKQDYLAPKAKMSMSHNSSLISYNYCYFTVRVKRMLDDIDSSKVQGAPVLRKAVNGCTTTHKLAVILSIFDRHGMILNYFGSNSSTTQKYLNKITDELAIHAQNITKYDLMNKEKPALPRTPYISECDQMCVGLKDSHHSISILKFCYSILCSKEQNIYQPTILPNVADGSNGIEDDDEHLATNVSVGPLTEDSFMPFVNYILMDKASSDFYATKEQQSTEFRSGKPGWCYGFWNANLYWFHVAYFNTLLKFGGGNDFILRVEQDQSNVLHNLC
ncbi:hypothetical protein C9374_012714 [Naegleria lovaniensis]|uniref:F-box domain-containing protein n=1 Tax=Naegleria lovaniensis TaxID=51637 RepID=A0AA88H3L6_NAELO|nr:uncharacterized protein C9374_012714 [Naegleria lovaniensis]KAG2392462.1 hypothetical protein C9374_012714 [Naegleria lovaniensis]